MPSCTTPFTIEGWDAHVIDGDLGRVEFRKTYTGDDLTGTAVVGFLNCGQIAYVAVERITGTLGGRTGSFALVHGAGAGDPHAVKDVSSGYVVEGSGTGELAGMTGTMEIRHDENGPTLYLDYEV